MRREGLYSSHIDTWRRQAASGQQNALAPKKRGPKAKLPVDPELKRLRHEVARLQVKLQRAEKVIEVQKKISEILGVEQNLPDELKDEEN